MRIVKMTATFGRLERAVLEPGPGLTVVEAPNEGGKSTWCAFLRAMLYGIPTRERDTKTTLAEKNRYQPWSGSPMEGEIELVWGGRRLFLRRFQRGAVPFGGFEAVYADTGEAVPGLSAENCGETLLGVSREVYQRSAFVGQGGTPIDGNPELEKRIAALVSSGEEDVSFSQVQETLKAWQRRRKRDSKNGLIPRLEAREEETAALLARLERNGRALTEAKVQAEELERRKKALEEETARQRARQDWALRDQYRRAVAELEAAQAETAALEREPIPPKEELREAQGELAYWNTLGANLKEAERAVEPARTAARQAKEAVRDPFFPDMDPEGAWEKANADAAKAGKKSGAQWLWLAFSVFWAALGALNFSRDSAHWFGWASLSLAVAWLARSIWQFWKSKRRKELLARYEAASPEEILDRARAYRERFASAEEAERTARTVERSVRELQTQRDQLWEKLITFVHTFAPDATDAFGVSAALSRALSLEERLATARVKESGARRLISSIPAPGGAAGGEGEVPPPSPHSPQQTAAALAAVSGELSRVASALAMAQGERNTLGDPAALEAEREQLQEELDRRREEYQALSVALEALEEANSDLQARFSPALNQRAGELFSELTGGRYGEVSLTRDFEAAAREEPGLLPRRSLSLSRGTVNQLYLAVRLAVCQLALPNGDPAPLVLDDALSDFDDRRAALALELLQRLAGERQVLLFTCHGRERRLLEAAPGVAFAELRGG